MERWQQDAAISAAHARWLEPDEPEERTYRCHQCEWEGNDPDGDRCPECGASVDPDEYDPNDIDRPEDDY